MYLNMDEKSIIDIDKLIEELKKLLDSFIEKFSNLTMKKQDSIESLIKKYSADEKFLKNWIASII